MGSKTNHDLSAVLFGKTRQAVLALLYGHPDEPFYLRQVARLTRAGHGAVQRELSSLVEAGIIQRSARGRQIYYAADRECPIFSELQQLIIKTAGVADVLRSALASLENRIDLAFIYGSFARGDYRRSSDVDLMVVGEVTSREIVSAVQSAQKQLQREINPTVYSLAEFSKKVKAGHHFLGRVLEESKIFVLGDERELAAVAGQRLA
jgi:predicted nucleotidyltransferase